MLWLCASVITHGNLNAFGGRQLLRQVCNANCLYKYLQAGIRQSFTVGRGSVLCVLRGGSDRAVNFDYAESTNSRTIL
jgi:hypothetical protein